MKQATAAALLVAALCTAAAAAPKAADAPAPAAPLVPGELTAEQIVEKNVAARGGLEAWRRVNTLLFSGHLESPDAAEPRLPFILEQKRPNKTHFEVTMLGRKNMRVFDGLHGWKVRAGEDGSPEAHPFSVQELKYARNAPGIEGPLIDYAAHGRTVSLVGTDTFAGHKTYRIAVSSAAGERNEVWIDAETFLETRFDRTSYDAKGRPGTVSVWYHDYQLVEGVQIPTVTEIGVGSGKKPDKLVVERIAVNAPLDDREFTQAGAGHFRHKRIATIDVPVPGQPNVQGGVPMMPAQPDPGAPQR